MWNLNKLFIKGIVVENVTLIISIVQSKYTDSLVYLCSQPVSVCNHKTFWANISTCLLNGSKLAVCGFCSSSLTHNMLFKNCMWEHRSSKNLQEEGWIWTVYPWTIFLYQGIHETKNEIKKRIVNLNTIKYVSILSPNILAYWGWFLCLYFIKITKNCLLIFFNRKRPRANPESTRVKLTSWGIASVLLLQLLWCIRYQCAVCWSNTKEKDGHCFRVYASFLFLLLKAAPCFCKIGSSH